jgi:hypothetical protein
VTKALGVAELAIAMCSVLAACDRCNPSVFEPTPIHTPTAAELKRILDFDLPANISNARLEEFSTGVYDSRADLAFTYPTANHAALQRTLPCTLAPDRCVWKHLHTEMTIEVTATNGDDHVTIRAEYSDNCLFEGCNPPPSK